MSFLDRWLKFPRVTRDDVIKATKKLGTYIGANSSPLQYYKNILHLRHAKCCGACKHVDFFEDDICVCTLRPHNMDNVEVEEISVCDKFEPAG